MLRAIWGRHVVRTVQQPQWYNPGRSAPFPHIDGCRAHNDKEERLRIPVMPEPPAPISMINWRWRWDGFRMGVPLAEIGTGSLARGPRCVNRRLVPSPGAMELRADSLVAVHGHRHRVDNDRAAIAQVPPQQHAACLSCVAGTLDKAVHGLPGCNTDL